MTINEMFDLLRSYEEGQKVEISDASNEFQCFDFAYLWSLVLGVPKDGIAHLYAYEIFTNPNDTTRKYFDIIPNSETFVPQKGDICVFDKTVGPAGHVCVADGVGDTNTFQSLDANWNGRQAVTQVTHTYVGFLGVLRPKVQATENPVPSITDQTILQTTSDGELEWQAIRSILEDRKKETTMDKTQIEGYEIQVKEKLDKINSLVNDNQALTTSNQNLGIDVASAKHTAEVYKQKIDELEAQQPIPVPPINIPVPSNVPKFIRRWFGDNI